MSTSLTREQWLALQTSMSTHGRFFHELYRRLLAKNFHADDPFLQALDRARDSLGCVAIHMHYAVCNSRGGRDVYSSTARIALSRSRSRRVTLSLAR